MPIDGDVGPASHAYRQGHFQDRETEKSQGDTQCSAGESKRDTLREKLTRDPASRRAQSRAKSHFFLAGSGAGQQQTGNVGTSYQQHQPSGARSEEHTSELQSHVNL